MCWIAAIPKGKQVKDEYLYNAYCNNKDGAGFMYIDDNGNLIVDKGYFSFEEFMDAFKKVPIEKARIVHFRQGTGGKKDAENCHPFFVNKNLAFAHNGVISIGASDNHSDTWHFNEEILKPLFNGRNGYKRIYNAGIQFLLKEAIGSGNKLAFLTTDEEVVIINETAGNKSNAEGIWYSNYMHLNSHYRSYQNKNYYRHSDWEYEYSGFKRHNDSVDVETEIITDFDFGKDIPTYNQFLQDMYIEYIAELQLAPPEEEDEGEKNEEKEIRLDAVGE